MAIVRNTVSGRSKTDPRKQWKWTIKVDDPLDALLDTTLIDDPDKQKLVCDAMCVLGLAKYRMFGEDTDTLESQEHHYTSTKAMRKFAREWLYTTKNWPPPR